MDIAPLTGWWFHSIKDERIAEQGQILRAVDGEYLVQFYDWWHGEPSEARIVALADMQCWRFYPIQAWLREADARDQAEGESLGNRTCPRCCAVGEILRSKGAPGDFLIIWRREGIFWSLDTGLSADEVRDPGLGCGYD